jgi:polyhydroxyalkanoate synthesis regulator phasin
MEEFLNSLEIRLQKLALKIKRIEAENELFRQDNDVLKAKVADLEQQLVNIPIAVLPDTQSEVFRQENEVLKEKIAELEQQLAILPTVTDPEKDTFTTNVNNARKIKRELELYLRETERKLEELRF